MTYDPQKHHRHTIRLQGYDYSRAGVYFITLVAQGRECLFGDVVNGEIKTNHYGQIIQNAWFDLPTHYPSVELDAFCIMPNHVHGIVVLTDDNKGGSLLGDDDLQIAMSSGIAPIANYPKTRPYINHPISEVIRAFKSFSARRINILRKTPGVPVWQRNYFEHIVRDNEDYDVKYIYILNNPSNWEKDDEYHPPCVADKRG